LHGTWHERHAVEISSTYIHVNCILSIGPLLLREFLGKLTLDSTITLLKISALFMLFIFIFFLSFFSLSECGKMRVWSLEIRSCI